MFSNNGKRPGASYLTMQDIRTIILLKVHGERFPCHPTWCRFVKWEKVVHAVIIMVGCVSEEDYKTNKECFKYLNCSFDQVMFEMKCISSLNPKVSVL